MLRTLLIILLQRLLKRVSPECVHADAEWIIGHKDSVNRKTCAKLCNSCGVVVHKFTVGEKELLRFDAETGRALAMAKPMESLALDDYLKRLCIFVKTGFILKGKD